MTPSRRAAETANTVADPNACVVQSKRYVGQVRWSKTGELQQKVEVTFHGPVDGPLIGFHWENVQREQDQ